MTSNIVFIDTETTGLDYQRHVPWEVALIVDGVEHVYTFKPSAQQLVDADPDALRINRFYERTEATDWEWTVDEDEDGDAWHHEIAWLTAGRHLAGIVPGFDFRMLANFLNDHGLTHAWHYQPIDVEVLAVGKLAEIATYGRDGDASMYVPSTLLPPWDGAEIARLLGIDASQFEKHTALGDARFAKALWEAVMGT